MKANPGKYNYGSAGAGGTTHVQFDAFMRQAGFQMTHIAYKGIAPAMQDLLGGQVQAMIAASTAATPYIASGKAKILAISGPKRANSLPNVPTLADQAFIEKTFDTFAFEPLGETPGQFAVFLKKDRAVAEKKIRNSGVQLDRFA